MTATRTPRTSLRDEPQPDPSALARIERVEDHGVRWAEESCEAFAARLAAWRARPSGPEPDVDDLVEDRSACDLAGMTTGDPVEPLAPYVEWLRAVLPGHAH